MTDKSVKKSKAAAKTKEEILKQLPKAIHHNSAYLNQSKSRNIHENLKFLRQKAGLTLEALSLVTKGVDPEGAGISRVSLSRYETGSEPGLRELKILSWALREPLAYLVYGVPDDPIFSEESEHVREPAGFQLEAIIERIVGEYLVHKGIKPEPVGDVEYKNLVEAAKKLAKP